MPDLVKLNQQKERILSLIRLKGPSLPVQIARAIGVSPLFAGAFLSELFGDKRLKMSNLRVGSSPLYYLGGQEELLEKYIEYLNKREREAYELLKSKKILEDDKLEPVARVAIRAVRDFAIPVRAKSKDGEKLFWKFYLLSEEESRKIMHGIVYGVKEESVKREIKEEGEKKELENKKTNVEIGVKEDKEVKKKGARFLENKPENKYREKEIQTGLNAIDKKSIEITNAFGISIKKYLESREMELIEVLNDKKKEFTARIKLKEVFGFQEYILSAKDKKSISDNDLIVALQQAQGKKMPALFISNGELTKKAKEHLTEWGNLVKFDRLGKDI